MNSQVKRQKANITAEILQAIPTLKGRLFLNGLMSAAKKKNTKKFRQLL